MKVVCGDANPGGNVAFTFKGGCRKEVDITDAYRCVGCGGWFHYDCILKHFEEEFDHDKARSALKQIKDSTTSDTIRAICDEGLKPTRAITNLFKR